MLAGAAEFDLPLSEVSTRDRVECKTPGCALGDIVIRSNHSLESNIAVKGQPAVMSPDSTTHLAS